MILDLFEAILECLNGSKKRMWLLPALLWQILQIMWKKANFTVK